MPGLDRTGPEGKGPMTGKNRGLCGGKNRDKNNKEKRENENRSFGKGRNRGRGRGFGKGFRNRESN